MINRVIEWSAAHRAAVVIAALAAAAAGWWSMQRVAARRDPRPQRHAGDRLLALGPQPGHRRGPGHLPDRHRAARRAEREGGARLLRLRLLVTSTSSSRTAPTSTGRARGRSSTCRRSSRACRRACTTELGPDATGVGWVFQYALVDRLGNAQPRRAALVPGLVPALRTSSRSPASPRSRRSAASSGSTR